MKKFIIFAGYVLVFSLMLSIPIFAHANCKEPKRGPQGPTGPQGPPFVTTFATWYVPGETQFGLPVPVGNIIPFSNNEASSGITNAAGLFTFSKSGVYQVTFGVFTNESSDQLDIELNGTLVPGGRLIPFPSLINTITVMFTAVAGDTLQVKNTGGQTANIGSGDTGTVASFISILQIN